MENINSEQQGKASMDYVTWKDFHPELAEIFDSVFDYKKTPWPCEIIDTGMAPIYQPCMTVGTDQELFVAGPGGQVFHSQDMVFTLPIPVSGACDTQRA